MFAHDCKIYGKCNNLDDSRIIGQDFTAVKSWMNLNQLSIAIEKCNCLHVGNGNPNLLIQMQGVDIEPVVSVRDLGIIIDGLLSFDNHIDTVCSKEASRLGKFFKAFASRDIDFLVAFFKTYVRPVVEFGSIIFNPQKNCATNQIENIQRRFTKRLPGMYEKTYRERLAALDLETLELRRLKTDLIFCYKLVHLLVDINAETFFTFASNHYSQRRSHRLLMPRYRPNVRKWFFAVRTVNVWNALSEDIVSAPSLAIFKTRLELFDFSSFLKVLQD